MNQPLTGKRALVTGASRGIGRATALTLASAGCDVIVNYVTSEAAAKETARAITAMGREAMVVRADMSEPEDIAQLIELVSDHVESLDILVSNAASGGFRNLVDAKISHFDAAMHTNVRSLMLLVQAALPLMKKAVGTKKVVALSSHGSYRSLPAYGLIGASKAAIESMIRHFAMELGSQGFNFNCVLAGLVPTDSTSLIPGAEKMFELMNEKLFIAKPRTLTPEDVANAVKFLCLPESDLIQGHTLIIDGGAALGV